MHVAQLVHLFNAKKHLETDPNGGFQPKLFSFALRHKSVNITPKKLGDYIERVIGRVESAV